MKFVGEFNVSDIISVIVLLTGIVGGIFGLVQWNTSVKIKKAEYINELTEKIRSDADIKEIVYMFDYDAVWYTPDFHNSGELELKIDKTLSYFSYICYLYKLHLITKNEFEFFRYEIERILLNRQVQNYFFNLYHFSIKFNVPFTFIYLFEYGENRRMFDEDFYNNLSTKYSHYLNF